MSTNNEPNGCRPAHLAQKQDLHLKLARVVLHAQQIAGMHFARGFNRLSMALNPAEIASSRSQRARLEKSRRPKPLIHPHALHNSILVRIARLHRSGP